MNLRGIVSKGAWIGLSILAVGCESNAGGLSAGDVNDVNNGRFLDIRAALDIAGGGTNSSTELIAVGAQASFGGSSSNSTATVPPLLNYGASLGDIPAFDAISSEFVSVPYRSMIHNDYNNYSLSLTRFTAPVDAAYLVCASLASFAQEFELDLFINGTRENAITASHSGVAQGCRTVQLRANDLLRIDVHQSSGSIVHFPSNHIWSWLTIQRTNTPELSVEDSYAGSLAGGTFTTLRFANELVDKSAAYDPVTGQFTARYSCPYFVCASAATFQPDFELDLFVGNTREKAIAISKQGTASGCRNIFLNAGDVLSVRGYQNSVAAMPIGSNTFWNWMTVGVAPSTVASMRNISPFTAPNGVFQTVPYNSKDGRIYGSGYDPSTSRFTAATDGDYNFCASLGSLTQDFELDLFINGARERAFANAHLGLATGCRTVRLKAGNYVEVKVYQSTGATMVFSANDYWDWLTVEQKG